MANKVPNLVSLPQYINILLHLQLYLLSDIAGKMSLPDKKVASNVDEVQLRHVVYDILIDKYLDDSSSTALAISEKCDGFSSVYSMSR